MGNGLLPPKIFGKARKRLKYIHGFIIFKLTLPIIGLKIVMKASCGLSMQKTCLIIARVGDFSSEGSIRQIAVIIDVF